MNNYSAEDIRKYLEGQLPGPEMQAMEKAALDDPFLADAIEGYQESLNHPVPFESELVVLNKKLRDRVDQRKNKKGIFILQSGWSVAASILLIIGLAFFSILYLNNKNKQNTIAKQTTTSNAEDKKKPASPVIRSVDSVSVVYTPASPINKRLSPHSSAVSPAIKPARLSALPEPQTTGDSPSLKPIDSDLAKNNFQKISSSPVTLESSLQGKAAGVSIAKSRNRPIHYVQGIVKNEEGKPVPFATVRIQGYKNAVSTDTSGYFKLYLENIKAKDQVVISGPGLVTHSSGFSTDSSLIPTYTVPYQSQSLNEVVVTGYASQQKKDITGSVTTIEDKDSEDSINVSESLKYISRPTPDPFGWDSLVRYVNTNKKMNSTDSVLTGEEVVSFVVNKKGVLSSFKIIKSLSPAHDAAIIRLIRSGPPLKIRKGRKQTCQITIVYP